MSSSVSGKPYDVFISYRQEGRDKDIAAALFRILTAYRTPRDLVRRGAARKLNVFMDREELSVGPNLGGKIADALARSRFLVVLCSPRTANTEWVEQEIRTFKDLSAENTGRVFAVMVEGTKQNVFPEEIYAYEPATAGLSGKRVEPLGFDVSAPSKRESLKRLKQSKFALIAPIIGVERSELERREQRRFRIQMLLAMGAMGLLAAFFASLFYAEKQKTTAMLERERARNNMDIAVTSMQNWTRPSHVFSNNKLLDRITDLEIKEVELQELRARDLTSLTMLDSLVSLRTQKVQTAAEIFSQSHTSTDTLVWQEDRDTLLRCMTELRDSLSSVSTAREGLLKQ